MSLRHRPMEPRDVEPYIDILLHDRFVGPRYGDVADALVRIWQRLLGSEAFRAVVFEEGDGTATRLLGAGIGVFATDAFVREIKTPPFVWMGPEVARRVACDRSPLLSNREVERANAGSGLNVLVCDGCVRQDDVARPEVIDLLLTSFFDQYRGFQLKEILVQATTPSTLEVTLNAGGVLLDDSGSYPEMPARDPSIVDVFGRPHVVGITRQLASRRLGSWIGSIFVYNPPRLQLRRSERRLLELARAGGTDKELAERLGVSISAVKKTWRHIYRRVAEQAPTLQLDPGDIDSRGPDKKQRLLAYLREHPEEMRPTPRRPPKRELRV